MVLKITLVTLLVAITCCSATEYEFVRAGLLPSVRGYKSSIYDGVDSVFIIGGLSATPSQGSVAYNDVLEFNIMSHTLSKVASIPPNIYAGATGTDGAGNLYHFGGYTLGFAADSTIFVTPGEATKAAETSIYKFTTESPEPLRIGNLPFPIGFHCAVSDLSGLIYLLGWENMPTDVIKYNTSDGTTEVVGQLPRPFQSGSAAWVDGAIYIFSGYAGMGQVYKTILKFTPEDGVTEVLEAELPGGAQYSSAVVVGTDIYVLGGINDDNAFVFVKFDTVTKSLEELSVANFSLELLTTTAIYAESQNRIYIFGGSGQSIFENYDDIYYIQL